MRAACARVVYEGFDFGALRWLCGDIIDVFVLPDVLRDSNSRKVTIVRLLSDRAKVVLMILFMCSAGKRGVIKTMRVAACPNPTGRDK